MARTCSIDDELRHAVGQSGGFSGAGAGEYQQRPAGLIPTRAEFCGSPLFMVQFVEVPGVSSHV
jgi:hypothetical protein